MSFLANAIGEFTHHGQGGQGGQGGQQPQRPQGYGNNPNEGLPPGWIAQWDERDQRWFYVNEQTGERSWERPAAGYGGGYGQQGYPQPQGGGYGNPQAGYGAPQGYGNPQGGYGQGYSQQPQGYNNERNQSYQGNSYQAQPPQQQPKKSHAMAYAAGGLAVGVLGTMVVEHEKDNIERGWDREEDRIGDRVDNGFRDVENFPDNAARWTGDKVGEVERIPQDVEYGYDREKDRVENRFDNTVQDVEDVPQDIGRGVDDAARWTGDKVGDVERFDQGIENSYDEGRDEGRAGDDNGRW